MMNNSEGVRDQLRRCLNRDKIKLWLSPYYNEDGSIGEIPSDLIIKYDQELGIGNHSVTLEAMQHLQKHALDKLASKKKFQETGIATLKVKLAGLLPEEVKTTTGNREFNVEISIHMTGNELQSEISCRTGIDLQRLKLIVSGHVVESHTCLKDVGVMNGSQVMALCLSESEAEARKAQQEAASVARTRHAAQLLSSKEDEDDDGGGVFLQIADQTGKPIQLPSEERKALALAMTLHEKGRAALKHAKNGEALLLLLEADKEFRKCRADILEAVDNYALVCLDIVWCYLLLRNVSDLPDAETRLKACENCFKKSYGPNLERLALVKGGIGTEKALFMRLHLLQGILAYHQNHSSEALNLLRRAQQELDALQVDEDKMTQVMEMGFTAQEARLGLRQFEGNVQLAISHIMQRREEKRALKEKEREEKHRRRMAGKLGKTANGTKVDVASYERLLSMGFAKGASAEALRQANNNLSLALQVLQENPHLLSLPDPEPVKFKVTDEMMSQVVALGFDAEAASAALRHFSGSVERAVEELLKSGGLTLPDWLTSSSSSSSSSSSDSSSKSGQSDEESKREKEAIDDIIPDLPQSEEDYLDLTLTEESLFLQQYMSLLASTASQ